MRKMYYNSVCDAFLCINTVDNWYRVTVWSPVLETYTHELVTRKRMAELLNKFRKTQKLTKKFF